MKKILFITGTRADYGKMKPLMMALEETDKFELNIYVSGMHLIEKLGSTYKEVLKDGYKNVYIDFAQINRGDMSYDLGVTISNLTEYVHHIKPDMIVVHGDRSDALAGAIVGAFHNIKVSHIEGGEVSGTIDESIRHAISKFSHFHLVCNDEAKKRLIQMGEQEDKVVIIGSPDIDIMYSDSLPILDIVKDRYDIEFKKYGILMYHPVTTEVNIIHKHINEVLAAVTESDKNYIVIYPNNDLGSDLIIKEYNRLFDNSRFKVFPSIRFEYFLTLLKNADFIIGNSSAGVRESGIYGIPAIDLGTRQMGRYNEKCLNVRHTFEDKNEILKAIGDIENYRIKNSIYGDGNSTKKFMEFINCEDVWKTSIQKHFIDAEML